MTLKTFTFNPFQENTYLLTDETRECAVIDAGNLYDSENKQLKQFIETNNLTLKRVINTHLHLDHHFGNRFIAENFGVLPEAHPADEFMIDTYEKQCAIFGIGNEVKAQKLKGYLSDNEVIKFGNTELVALHCPGHSPGSLAFYSQADNCVFAGDVLFRGSIGRTDLPQGNYATLIRSITERLLILPDDTVVYSGHGQATNIGYEKQFNPFL
jgi:glyoxylase-like metal-dependent hydrolase (beta-lactamase superfamily II)